MNAESPWAWFTAPLTLLAISRHFITRSKYCETSLVCSTRNCNFSQQISKACSIKIYGNIERKGETARNEIIQASDGSRSRKF